MVGNELGVMEELRECAFYRPRGGSGRQRRDGVLVREQGQRYSEEWNCRHTRDETAKPAGAAKRDGAAVRNGAESYQTVTCGLIVGPECRDVRECGLACVARSAKGNGTVRGTLSRILARGGERLVLSVRGEAGARARIVLALQVRGTRWQGSG